MPDSLPQQPPKLTVLIPCKDERRNIRACIEAARPIADEILVADSGSTDGTLQIVQQLGGCRIIQREYIHSGDFKNWAIPQSAHPWVLLVDADERITPQLAAEIRNVLADPRQDGYWIYRHNHFMGHPVRHSGWNGDRCLRLFRRDLSRYVGDNDHAEITVQGGNVGRLKARMIHYTYTSYDQYFPKLHRYTKYQAGIWHRSGRRPSYLRLLLAGPLRFLLSYLFRGGFLDGKAGLQVCMLTAFYSFMKQARLWEMCEAIQHPELPADSPDQPADSPDQPAPPPRGQAA